MNKKIKIVECPRDAMQGLSRIIPTKLKAEYINSLIKVGFEYIDFGSFVSSKIVPQMSDTIDVLKLLNIDSQTSLLAVILNKKGAEIAASFDEIKILGYPLSISEIFQKKNSNKSIKESLHVIDQILEICYQKTKEPLIYFSMAFGNPYNELWDKSILLNYINQIKNKGVNLISLADTIGNSDIHSIRDIYYSCAVNFPDLDIGLHLHSHPNDSFKKIQSAWESGCRRFDVAISGYGGCPFAQDQLVGNISTQQLLNFLAKNNLKHSLDLLALENSYNQSREIFD
tara:strand:- start:313 stop:1167 length:855 start_codon:yes stop_codon:yes gene_type:complete